MAGARSRETMSNILSSAAGYLFGIFILWGLRSILHAIANRNTRHQISKWQSHTRNNA